MWIGQVASDLPNTGTVRIGGNSGDLDTARFHLHDDEHEERHESVLRPSLGCCEVDGGERFPMGLQKCSPRGAPFPIRSGLNAIVFQDVADGLIADGVPDVGQGPLNPVVALGRILASELQHQINDRLVDGRGRPGEGFR